MKIIIFLLSVLAFSPSLFSAQDTIPLRVGIDSFTPPFVMEGANRQYFGFDISMMEYICKHIQRRCIFIPLNFEQIFNAVEKGEVNTAVSALTITSARATRVNFSIPYLLSASRFLGSSEWAKQPFGLAVLHNRRIGVEKGTIFPAVIEALGVRNPKIIEYADAPTLIDALQTGKIDFVLIDDPSAIYWQSQSSGKLRVLGQGFTYGFGFGIAINPREIDLLREINQALVSYQNSKEFKRDYGKYIAHF
jgi:polar amino acid transport system substrate-binding protein